ncbi:hypothetical protein [Sulfurifustis variabilis]|nr:hypothetical protein [Sulfurifustis variabilis]
MSKLASMLLAASVLLAGVGYVPVANACADAHADPGAAGTTRAPAEAQGLPDTNVAIGAVASGAACECDCAGCLSCVASTGCASHGAAAFTPGVAGADPGVVVTQFHWSSPSLSFLVPTDTEPPRAAA